MNFNKAIIIGNLTRDPERKNLPSGQAVVNFGVATNRFYTTQDGQRQQETEFHNVVAFGKLAETISQYLNKGSLVLIEGRLRTRNWEDASGIKHYRTEIITERVQLGPKRIGQESTDFASAANAKIRKSVSGEEIPVIEEEFPNQTKGFRGGLTGGKSENRPPESNWTENDPTKDRDEEEEIDVSKIPF